MESIVFDFKSSLKLNSQPSNKKDFLNNKDFSSTLESLNKSINNKDSFKSPSKLNEDKKSIVSENNQEFKQDKQVESESLKEENNVENNTYVYGNIMYFLNNLIEIKDDSDSHEETELEFSVNNEVVVVDENSQKLLDLDNKQKELIIKEESPIIITNDKTNSKINEKDYKLINAFNNEIVDESLESEKSTNREVKFDSKIVQSVIHEDENGELSNTKETNVPLITQLNEQTRFNSQENSESKSSIFEEKSNTSEVEKVNEDTEVNEEFIISMDKDDLIIIKDRPIELNKTDTVNKKEVIHQIVEKAKIDLSDGKNEIRIKLKPEVLGEMTMNLEVIKGSITAKIMVDSQRTKEIIEGNLIQLKEGIKDTGLEIKTFEVFVGNNSDFDKHNSQSSFRQNSKRVKIKTQDSKVVRYGEQTLENQGNTNETYLENRLNLLA